MNETKIIQKYLDQIYGKGTYQAEHEAFKGFYARSLTDDRPPHSIFLGSTAGYAHSKLDELHDRAIQTPITLSEAICYFDLAYSTLAQAAREGRFEARQSGPKTWITTRAAIQKAIDQGKLRPRK